MMGCDIHFHTEIKVNGRWEHYSKPKIHRNYKFFTLIANVRNYSNEIPNWITPFRTAENIFPNDLNLVTYLSLIKNNDIHSIITYDSQQIHEFYTYMRENTLLFPNKYKEDENLLLNFEWQFIGYLEGNSWDIVSYPDEKPEWVEDVRWVIGFDN
jgi:hypothetical protein